MALSDIDRNLLERCVARKPRAWEDFVDRFMGLVLHVVEHSARVRSIALSPEDREDLCALVFLEIIKDDFAVLRHFRRQASLATYLTVVARRVVVRALLRQRSERRQAATGIPAAAEPQVNPDLDGITDRDELERLLGELDEREAAAVRMHYLEHKSYAEIAQSLGIAENSVGPLLSRAREKMRRARTS